MGGFARKARREQEMRVRKQVGPIAATALAEVRKLAARVDALEAAFKKVAPNAFEERTESGLTVVRG